VGVGKMTKELLDHLTPEQRFTAVYGNADMREVLLELAQTKRELAACTASHQKRNAELEEAYDAFEKVKALAERALADPFGTMELMQICDELDGHPRNTQLEESRKDTARLDAFPRIGYVLWQSDEGKWNIRRPTQEYLTYSGDTPREAIDEAMKHENNQQ